MEFNLAYFVFLGMFRALDIYQLNVDYRATLHFLFYTLKKMFIFLRWEVKYKILQYAFKDYQSISFFQLRIYMLPIANVPSSYILKYGSFTRN
jgi:hypothetical protein